MTTEYPDVISNWISAMGALKLLASKEHEALQLAFVGSWLQSIGTTLQAIGATEQFLES